MPGTKIPAPGSSAVNMDGALAEDLGRLQDDLQLARELQQAMLPLQYPTFPHGVTASESALLFHHDYRANSAIGGDFFSVFPISDSAAGVFLCDVMGHGVRSALVAAMVGALLEESKPLAADPGALLTEINHGLTQILLRARTTVFTSAFYLVADTNGGQLRFSNAGHPPPLHVQHARRRGAKPGGCAPDIQELDGAFGPALGMISNAIFPTGEAHLSVGDLLLLFTDGLYEATRDDGELFGQERLVSTVHQMLCQSPNASLGALGDSLIDAAEQFAGGFEDDLCLLGMEVTRLGVPSEPGRDGLTGLFNRNYLDESLEREVHRALRHGYHVGVISLDIEGLEEYARKHGKRATDHILREFGTLLNLHTRRSDIACRPRDTGFTLVLPEASPDKMELKAAQLCNLLKSHCPLPFENGELAITLGMASFPQHGDTGEAVAQAAATAMKKNSA